jgi:hypothetical protein
MVNDQSLIARALHKTGDATPRALTPETLPDKLSTLPSLTNANHIEASATFNRTAMLGILGIGVVVPTNDTSFMKACSLAFSAEELIRDSLASELRDSPAHLKESFVTMLSNHHIVSAILSRIERYQSEGERKVAGLELGVSVHPSLFGNALAAELEWIYSTIPKELPRELLSACEAWGRAQADAREIILAETWQSVVNRSDWSRPTGFNRIVSGFLEGQPLTHGSLVNAEVRFAHWLNAVQTLRDGSASPVFTAAKNLKRNDLLVADVVAASTLFQEKGLLAWSESLWKVSPGHEARIAREIWPHPEILPEHTIFAEGVPTQVTISVTQALDHWSRYIANLPLDGFTIHSHAMNFSDRSALSQELAEVGHTPLANFIHKIEIDLHEATSDQIARSLRASINLLSAMVKGSDWHDNSREHTVTLALLHCPESERLSVMHTLRREGRRTLWELREISPINASTRFNHVTLAFHYSPS